MSHIELSGFGKRTIHPGYDDLKDTPLLKEFYFLFSAAGPVDHHINQIMVQPDGAITDLAPSADPPSAGTNPNDGRIRLSYQDDEGQHEYFFSIAHETVKGLTRFRMRDVGCQNGKCVRLLPPAPAPNMTFALVGFQLFFTGGRDHQIDEFGIQQQGRFLTVTFNDKNDDDVFGYAVDYAWLNPGLVLATGRSAGVAIGGERVPVPTLGTKVISGFKFNFATKDHELRDVGIRVRSSGIDLYYGDHNFDDRFMWQVSWVSLRPQFPIFPII